jgi:preprotein translocase SecE subunit
MKLLTYLKETKGELAHVNWPTRDQAIAYTLIVIGLSAVVGILLGAFDFVYTSLIKLIII